MRRWAFNLFCLVSLLIFAAGMALWVRSYFFGEMIRYEWETDGKANSPDSARTSVIEYSWAFGGQFIQLHSFPSKPGITPHDPSHYVRWEYPTRRDGTPCAVELFVFLVNDWTYHNAQMTPENGWQRQVAVSFPDWLFLPFAIPPVLWWKRRKNRGRGFPVQAASQTPAAS